MRRLPSVSRLRLEALCHLASGIPCLEEVLVQALIKRGLVTSDQVRTAQQYGSEHQRDLRLHRGLGWPACFQTGYMGRTGIFEIMMVGEELRDLIFQQIPKDVLRRVAVDLGMRTLKQSAVDKILDGTTTVEEVYRVVSF